MCDTIVAIGRATCSHAVLFGKNSDREYTEAQYLISMPPGRHRVGERLRLTYTEIDQVPQTYGVLLSKPHWIWGAEIGANEHGLVIGNEAIFSKIAASATPGIIGMDYLRLALERARDVEEGIGVITSLLAEHGQSGNCGYEREFTYHNSFLLADPGGAKVLETVEREWAVKDVDDYYAISNAMTIEETFSTSSPTLRTRAMQAGLHHDGAPFRFSELFEDGDRVASGHHRRARASELIASRRGGLCTRDFFDVLRDHVEGQPLPGRASGPRICAHAHDNPIGQTTASWVSEIAPGRAVHWVTGTAAPCTGVFKPVVIGAGLPDHGTQPGANADNTSLWWRHEQLRPQLERVGRELQDEYGGERDRLEHRFRDLMTSSSSGEGPEGDATLQLAVGACWREALAFESRWLDRLRNET